MKNPRLIVSLSKNTYEKIEEIAEEKELSKSSVARSLIVERIRSMTLKGDSTMKTPQGAC